MRITTIIIFIAFIAVVSCNNITDADPSPRKTFVKFYEGPFPITATSVAEIPTGYVILGNALVTEIDTTFFESVLIETDKDGNQVGDFHPLEGGTGKSFQPIIDNGTVSGYIVVGDNIFTDPQAPQAANVIVSSLRVVAVGNDFEPIRNRYISDNRILGPNQVKADFFGGAINLTDNGVIILGTYKEGVANQQAAPEKQLLFALDNDLDLDSAWFKTYDLLGNTYLNSKSVHYTNGKIIWASAIADIQGDFTFSYVTVPFVEEQSVFENFSQIGQTTLQLFIPSDIQPASSPAFGYGVVGTYSEQTDGLKGNMFFLRVDANGNIIPGSDRYFDAIESFGVDITDVDKNTSSIVDNGEAITSTSDGGFVLAGTLTTNPVKGKGGKDLFLVKVNAFGDVVWMKTMGGTGDEVPISIRETGSGDLLVCGTNTIGDYASVFLMKMDKNGELKN
jgi:hypothetical protein